MCRENVLEQEGHNSRILDINDEEMTTHIEESRVCAPATCYICDKSFTRQGDVYRHIRRVHGVNPTFNMSLHCPLCDTDCRTYNDIDEHIGSCHGIAQEVEELSFDSSEGNCVYLQNIMLQFTKFTIY